jgi:dTDP-glucose 4,6-dehydratase
VARSIFDDRIFFETDVLGTQSVASAVAKSARTIDRFLHVSTSEVYGTAEAEVMDEEHPLKPRSPYASAKAGADRLVYSYLCTYDLPAVIVRPFNNYGPYQHLEKAVPRFITSAILGEELPIHGDGRSSRDWLYVGDHAEALDRLVHCDLAKVRGEVINLGTGRSISIRDVASIILEAASSGSGRSATRSTLREIEDRPGQVSRHTSSTAKAERLLGWKARTSFEEGVRSTIDWYRSNEPWWRKLLWMRQIPILTADGEVVQYY